MPQFYVNGTLTTIKVGDTIKLHEDIGHSIWDESTDNWAWFKPVCPYTTITSIRFPFVMIEPMLFYGTRAGQRVVRPALWYDFRAIARHIPSN